MLEKYAQEISDTTSRIIGYHVLITDKDGGIIGSSNSKRLGEFLNEVPEVIRTRKGYIVTAEEAGRIENTQIGVTYPIEDIDGEIAGTIAITGDPEKVDPFALIVQKQAEMYLREKAYLETVMYQERTIQTFIKDILAFDPRVTGKGTLEKKAREFGYDKKLKYVAIYVNYHLTVSQAADGREPIIHSRALSLVRSVFSGKNDISALMEDNVILIFHALTSDPARNETFDSISKKSMSLQEQMVGHGLSACFGIGSIVLDLAEWLASYTEAREVFERGRIFYPSETIFFIRNYRFHELIASTRKNLRYQFAGDLLAGLNLQRDSSELKDTISKWCQSNFCVKDTAQVLHIHRNTLHYRIEKIEKICGFSMRDFTKMMELYMALQLEKINNHESTSW